jgi:hypothetical protein
VTARPDDGAPDTGVWRMLCYVYQLSLASLLDLITHVILELRCQANRHHLPHSATRREWGSRLKDSRTT